MKENIYVFIFTSSPLFYLLANLYTFISIKENKTYEMEMVCKYNIYELSSFRMLVFSILAIIINSIVLLFMHKNINLLKGLMISITSVFMFSSLFLYVILKIKYSIGKWIVPISWIIFNVLFSNFNLSKYAMILSNIPLYVYGVVCIMLAYVYMKNIEKFIFHKGITFQI
ncbi:hypothetical protein [Clostridium tarantellae]|uniref:Uncharacterized protein n=1 Tax=Clostridium tarantellae TaxID=39493 RepID=A0A6I1MP73_9CLOT|nr:hypothetical protein [Clostridium tarantellae]MPQ43917.1 hypothetical protein [Clostridium tarantellae]